MSKALVTGFVVVILGLAVLAIANYNIDCVHFFKTFCTITGR